MAVDAATFVAATRQYEEELMRERILTILLLATSLPVYAAFMTGAQLKENLDEARSNSSFKGMAIGMGYVTGVYDMVDRTQVCITQELSAREAMQIVHTYLNTHRSELEQPAATLVVKALSEEFPCKQ
jgi:Ssp1 endopeptidase immunity protein Rap1a